MVHFTSSLSCHCSLMWSIVGGSGNPFDAANPDVVIQALSVAPK